MLMIPCLAFTPYYEPRTEMLRSPELSSLVQCVEAPILPMSRLQLFGDLLGVGNTEGAGRDIRMNPGNATMEEVKKLPPTIFGVSGMDPLRDEGLFYAKLLSENG
jgi:acetyl esterase/lipase